VPAELTPPASDQTRHGRPSRGHRLAKGEPHPMVCPGCGGTRAEPMPLRTNRDQSGLTWYECCDCSDTWSVPTSVKAGPWVSR
jgi:DNA-directed RNA polymerase subunit M/transcription elongation factor TFIIS